MATWYIFVLSFHQLLHFIYGESEIIKTHVMPKIDLNWISNFSLFHSDLFRTKNQERAATSNSSCQDYRCYCKVGCLFLWNSRWSQKKGKKRTIFPSHIKSKLIEFPFLHTFFFSLLFSTCLISFNFNFPQNNISTCLRNFSGYILCAQKVFRWGRRESGRVNSKQIKCWKTKLKYAYF